MEWKTTRSQHKYPWPEISVTSTNGTVFLRPEIVCACRKLRRRVVRHMQEFNGWEKGHNVKMSYSAHVDEMTETIFVDCTDDLKIGYPDEDIFGTLPLLSSYVWRVLQDFCVYHILEIKRQEERAKGNMPYVNWNKPFEKPPPYTKDWNAVSTFEEEMFGNMEPAKFLSVVQGKNALGLDDLHKVTENWFRLYTGRDVKCDPNGNEVPAEPCLAYKKNFRVISNHYIPGFYKAAAIRIPNNAKEWTWWQRRY